MNDDNSVSIKNVKVTWDTSIFDSKNFNTTWKQNIYGKIEDEDEEISKLQPILTTKNNHFMELIGVSNYYKDYLPFKNVAFGVTKEKLSLLVKNHYNWIRCYGRRKKSKSNDTHQDLFDVTIPEWDTSNYIPNKTGEQIIHAKPLPYVTLNVNKPSSKENGYGYEHMVNPNNVIIPCKIITNIKGTVFKYVEKSLTVPVGTGKDTIKSKLGNTIIAYVDETKTTDSEFIAKTTETLDIEWDLSTLDNSTSGENTIQGTIVSEDKGNYEFSVQPTATITFN